MSDHLRLKGGLYHWRITVPPDLKHHFRKNELIRTTGTGDKRLAQRYAMKWTAEAKEHFDELRNGKVTSRAEMVAVARRVLEEGLRDLKLKAGVDLDDFYLAVEAEMDNWRGIIDPKYLPPDMEVVREEVDEVIRRYGLSIPKGSPQYVEFTELLARAMIQVFVIAMRRASGEHGTPPWDDLSDGGLDNMPPRSLGFLVRSKATPLASEMFDRWLAEGSQKWAPRTVLDYRLGRTVLLDIAGDLPVSEITRDDIRNIREHVIKLPADWRRTSQYRGLSIREIVAGKPPGPYLKPATVQKYLQAISGMLKMAVEDGLIDRNVSDGLVHVHDPVPANRKRLAWDTGRLNQWFTWDIYEKPKSTWTYHQWLPLLGLFTGARLEELARLRVDDIRTVSGVLVIDIRWREGEPLKTQAAERQVPVHSGLTKLGFAKYVERVRRSGTSSLWPSLRRPKPPRKWGQAFTQWFTRARRAAGVYKPKLDYHSFRGNFTTALVNADVPLERIQALVGHRQQGVTMGVYAKAVDVNLLKKGIEKLKYAGLDLSGLMR